MKHIIIPVLLLFVISACSEEDLELSENNVEVISSTEVIEVGAVSDINFDVEGDGVYTATYQTDNIGDLKYGGLIIEPNEEFILEKGNTKAEYVGGNGGEHNLVFSIITPNKDEIQKRAQLIYKMPVLPLSFSATKQDGPYTNGEIPVDFQLEGEGNFTIRFQVTSDGDEPVTFTYNGQTISSANEEISINTGSSTGIIQSNSTRSFGVLFIVTSDNGETVSDILNLATNDEISFSATKQDGPYTNGEIPVDFLLEGEGEFTLKIQSNGLGRNSYNFEYENQIYNSTADQIEISKGNTIGYVTSNANRSYSLLFIVTSNTGISKDVLVTFPPN